MMHIAGTPAIERVARVLAAHMLSCNGRGDLVSAASEVDGLWHEHVDAAMAVLRTLREPDANMAAHGDAETWARMVDAALHA